MIEGCSWHIVNYFTSIQVDIRYIGLTLVTNPCLSCNEDGYTLGHNRLYAGELYALLFTLSVQLRQRHANSDVPSAVAIVVNMTPAKVRVLQGVIEDVRDPAIQISVLDAFDHDIKGDEHTTSSQYYEENNSPTCQGCARILSWLFCRQVVEETGTEHA
jgi:hypothetical protein